MGPFRLVYPVNVEEYIIRVAAPQATQRCNAPINHMQESQFRVGSVRKESKLSHDFVGENALTDNPA